MRPITNSVPIEKISTPGSCAMLPAPLLTIALTSHYATPILPVCRCPRKTADPAMGVIASQNPSRFFPQGVEQRLGLLESGGIKAFGEPAIDRSEQRAGLSALALALPQATQAHGVFEVCDVGLIQGKLALQGAISHAPTPPQYVKGLIEDLLKSHLALPSCMALIKSTPSSP